MSRLHPKANGLRLQTRILIVALLPTLLVALVVGGYLLGTRMADLHQSQQRIGENIVRHLAPASEFAILSGDERVLRRLAERLATDPGVRRVTIRDAERRVLSEARSPHSGVDDTTGFMARIFPAAEDQFLFSAPVRLGMNPDGEYEQLFQSNTATDSDDDGLIGSVEVQLSTVPLIERQTDVLKLGLALITGGLLLAWVLAIQVGITILRPINGVIRAIRQFRGGDLDARVPERSRGEGGYLERGFNELAEEVQSSRQSMEAQIEQATRELRETLEAVEIKNVELDLARRRAEDSNRIKSEFLANISHEIRTPMNAIFGYTQLLARTELHNNQKAYIGTIQRSVDSLLSLLEDVLNLSRIEAGRVDLEESEFHPEVLIEDTLTMMAPAIFDRELELIWHPGPKLGSRTLADAVKIRQILNNLLSNAAKFTQEGYIAVHADLITQEGDTVLQIDVVDTGIGIRLEDTSRLFQAFSQLDSKSSRQHQGAGLGLVICQQLAHLMGGRMEVESEPGHGSRFRTILPVRIIETITEEPLSDLRIHLFGHHQESVMALRDRLECWGAQAHQVDELAAVSGNRRDKVLIVLSRQDMRNDDYLDKIKGTVGTSNNTLIMVSTLDRTLLQEMEQRLGCSCVPSTISGDGLKSLLLDHDRHSGTSKADIAALARPDPHSLDGLSVMIVEDNRVNRQLTKEFLENAGATTHAAVDGHSALELAERHSSDVVLMDIQLPGMDGLETLSHLRQLPDYREVPVIALTASASAEERQRCEKAGTADILVKPVREEILLERIRRVTDAGKPEHSEPDNQDTEPRTATPQAMGRDAEGRLKPAIADMVRSDLPSQLATARELAENGRYQDLDGEVHRIRGTAAFCGFNNLAETCEKIRVALDESPPPETTIATLMARLESDIEAVLESLDQ